ncbi:sulfurtransferase TusA family protein [Candidatus Bathyarchaeota archaeon]|nr:sulfurtransferase TusA family protein [Candidatus Bathyarchaeota archaeon]
MSENDPSAKLDVQGLFCPIPIVKLVEEMKKHPTGTVIEVLATDPGTLADIPAWAKSSGNEVLDTKKEENVFKFLIKKIK